MQTEFNWKQLSQREIARVAVATTLRQIERVDRRGLPDKAIDGLNAGKQLCEHLQFAITRTEWQFSIPDAVVERIAAADSIACEGSCLSLRAATESLLSLYSICLAIGFYDEVCRPGYVEGIIDEMNRIYCRASDSERALIWDDVHRLAPPQHLRCDSLGPPLEIN